MFLALCDYEFMNKYWAESMESFYGLLVVVKLLRSKPAHLLQRKKGFKAPIIVQNLRIR